MLFHHNLGRTLFYIQESEEGAPWILMLVVPIKTIIQGYFLFAQNYIC